MVSTGSTDEGSGVVVSTGSTDENAGSALRKDRPGVRVGEAQLVVSAVSSITNDVCSEESSAPLNEIVTV